MYQYVRINIIKHMPNAFLVESNNQMRKKHFEANNHIQNHNNLSTFLLDPRHTQPSVILKVPKCKQFESHFWQRRSPSIDKNLGLSGLPGGQEVTVSGLISSVG